MSALTTLSFAFHLLLLAREGDKNCDVCSTDLSHHTSHTLQTVLQAWQRMAFGMAQLDEIPDPINYPQEKLQKHIHLTNNVSERYID